MVNTFQAISTWEDGRLKTIIKPKDSNKKEQLVVREIVDGEMIQVCIDAHGDGYSGIKHIEPFVSMAPTPGNTKHAMTSA